jgi:site-specific DNA recombinase
MVVEEPMMTAATYTRISHLDQSKYSLPSQREACLKLAAERGYRTSDEFCFCDDGGLSTELDRAALTSLREAARAGLIQAVVIHSLDRLSRQMVHQLLLLEEFQKRGVEVLFVDAPTDATPEGKMLLMMRGMFAEYERAKIRERTSRGQRRRAQENKICCRAPYGYVATPSGSLVPDPARAAVVQMIFESFAAGSTAAETAIALNRDRIAPPRGDQWIRGTCTQIVHREAYYSGRLPWGRGTAAEPVRRRKPAPAGRSKLTSVKRVDESRWIWLTVPPLIDRDLFERAQRGIESNRKWKSGRPSLTYLLAGALRCASCGAAMTGGYSHGHSYYRCTRVDGTTGRRACNERGVRTDKLEPFVWNLLLDIVSSPVEIAKLRDQHYWAEQARESGHAAERKSLAARIEKLRKREFRCRQSMLDSDLSASYSAFADDLKTTVRERQEAERRLEAIQPVRPPAQETYREFCKHMKGVRTITDRTVQRDFIRACIATVTVGRESLDLQFEINAPNALLAIQRVPDGPADGGGMTANCQLRQRAKIDRTAHRRRQETLQPERPSSWHHRANHRQHRRRPHPPRRLLPGHDD